MVLSGYKVTSAKLANGETVSQNDHVYISLPWSDRDGTPYNIARIIEFLPPHTTPKKGSRVTPSAEIMVRLSLYYRPADISARNVSDFRLLLAAIHTDIQPLSNVRGRCHVRHKDRIDDLLKWKKLPDHFYFVKFFDPYIKREFEVIRTESVNNIPLHVKQVLMARYEYLVTEREMVSDLTEAFRSCCVCSQWASYQESVKCEACKKHYHMSCLTPPLLAKPAKGYSWVCLPCSFQRHKDIEQHKFLYTQNGSVTAKGKAKAKEKSSATDARPDVTFRGWPWRYFGVYTTPEDTLDPEDGIFPRAATRVGRNYQANVPTWGEEQERRGLGIVEAEAGPSRHGPQIERGHSPGERKHESTIDVKSVPSDDLVEYMQDVGHLKLAVPPWDVERLNLAIAAYTSKGREKAFKYMRHTKLADFSQIHFSDKETSVFEAEIERNGGLETHETGRILGRKPAEVLRFSYIWKNRQLKSENEALRQHHKVNIFHARQNKTLGAPSLGRMRAGGGGKEDHSDDEISLYNASFVKDTKMQCAACSTRMSNVWWRCPRTVQGIAMCENCGSNYRKYGVISFVKSEDSKKAEKKEPGTKKGKGDASGTATPVPPPPPKLPPCSICKKMEPKPMMARCKNCTFAVHAGCFGIPSQDMGPDWECDLCVNIRIEENHLEPQCMLCPRDLTPITSKIKRKPAAGVNNEFDFLSALKPTEGRRWAHILCSAWIGEINYADPGRMKTVEGIMNVSKDRWEGTCSLCNQSDGAVINCTDCEALFHPACAWLSGCKIGFEFSLAKPGRHQTVTVTKFKDSEGVMGPGCWCKSHDLEGRVIYDLHEIDPEQNETALQIYSSAYKAIPSHDSFPTLRKAQRLEAFLSTSASGQLDAQLHSHGHGHEHGHGEQTQSPTKECENCHIDVSPIWHHVLRPTVLPVQAQAQEAVVKDEMMDVDGGGDGALDIDADVDVDVVTHGSQRALPHVYGNVNGVGKEVGHGGGKMRVCHLCWFRYR